MNAATISWDNINTITINNIKNKYLPKGSELDFTVSGFTNSDTYEGTPL